MWEKNGILQKYGLESLFQKQHQMLIVEKKQYIQHHTKNKKTN